MSTFTIGESNFLLDGYPFRVLSGALHYFRVHPDQWADRIHKAKLMGLNTIETYVAWNLHAPTPDEWLTDGHRDLNRFLEIVAAEGMYAIVRPGPYICAEWDNGGLPSWLYADATVGVRRREPRYLAAVSDYLKRVYDIVVPLQVDCGGPVILVQIENEYGGFGSDQQYLRTLVDLTRGAGVTVPLTTVDQPTDTMLANGTLPDLHCTGSFGSRSPERLATLRRHQPTGPLMASEYWVGWFDHWGGIHHTTPAEVVAADFDDLLAAGASVNIYMFHGGTSFGLSNGADHKGTFEPGVTSYDFDAPLDEAGRPTAKYWALRDVIAKYAKVPDERPASFTAGPQISGHFTHFANVLAIAERFHTWTPSLALRNMDKLNHPQGLIAYATEVATTAPANLAFHEVRDRAHVYADDRLIGVLDRQCGIHQVEVPAGPSTVTLLVENQGRVNYGPRIGEPKGLIGPATLDGDNLTGWRTLPIEVDAIDKIAVAIVEEGNAHDLDPTARSATWARGEFDTEKSTDLYLDTSSWGKGIAWINDFCLGRYWDRGPQATLYVPDPVVRTGRNELIILELEPTPEPGIRFVAEHDLGYAPPIAPPAGDLG